MFETLRRPSQDTMKCATHPFRIGETRLLGDPLYGLATILDQDASRFDAQPLDRAGEWPVSARKARLNCRGLKLATSASVSTDNLRCRFFLA